ncbi:MAG: hypothetical protein PHZ00_07135 [Candidatus Peribacteraceae bacterium]|nr:hypothetical protein [Candidatus Peribacteraceae bacterium]
MSEAPEESTGYPVGTEMLRLFGVSDAVQEWARGATMEVEFGGLRQPVRDLMTSLLAINRKERERIKINEGAQIILESYQQREHDHGAD